MKMNTLPSPRYFDRLTPPHVTTLILITAASAIPMNIFLASLPEMALYYQQPYSMMQLTLTGYMALMGLLQLIIGPLSDRIGRRPVLLWALVLFVIASVGVSLATNFKLFMVFRCLQAFIVSGFVISRAAIRDIVSREKATSMLGYVAMGMAMAPMIAPVLGGILTDAFGWQSNFQTLAIVGFFTLVIVYFDQGETNIRRSKSFTDQFQAYPELMKSSRFWGYCFTLVFAVGTFFTYLGGAPYVGDQFFSLSASQMGIYLSITPLGYMIGSGISGCFASHISLYKMIITGCLISLIGMSVTLFIPWIGITHPIGFYGFTFSIGIGNGLIIPSATTGLLDVKPELSGSASGLGGSFMTLGGALLSTLSGFLLTKSSGIYPLIYCIVSVSFMSFVAALCTVRIERKMRSQA
ncbi:multidrug effflux MFS transporter [Candidatus Endowatersipora endosymbiont of Watersipora subatra]|uniref:multidrug effflux MFS transporter n=1 Tax=Candidatus Endowatersipora endosymbiont of Watersipora subatra TaxID=3077946 RepID=UPI00312C6F0F